jgi:MbtH protein
MTQQRKPTHKGEFLMSQEIGDTKTETEMFRVVITPRGEYFLWPAYRNTPAGWQDEGTTGLKTECMTYIEQKHNELASTR